MLRIFPPCSEMTSTSAPARSRAALGTASSTYSKPSAAMMAIRFPFRLFFLLSILPPALVVRKARAQALVLDAHCELNGKSWKFPAHPGARSTSPQSSPVGQSGLWLSRPQSRRLVPRSGARRRFPNLVELPRVRLVRISDPQRQAGIAGVGALCTSRVLDVRVLNRDVVAEVRPLPEEEASSPPTPRPLSGSTLPLPISPEAIRLRPACVSMCAPTRRYAVSASRIMVCRPNSSGHRSNEILPFEAPIESYLSPTWILPPNPTVSCPNQSGVTAPSTPRTTPLPASSVSFSPLLSFPRTSVSPPTAMPPRSL